MSTRHMSRAVLYVRHRLWKTSQIQKLNTPYIVTLLDKLQFILQRDFQEA